MWSFVLFFNVQLKVNQQKEAVKNGILVAMNQQSTNIVEVTRPVITHMTHGTIKKSCVIEQYAKITTGTNNKENN